MKKIVLIILLFFSVGLLPACSSHKELNTIDNKEPVSINVEKQDAREMAYNQLDSNYKEIIAGSWQDSKLSTVTLREGMGIISSKSYIGKEVYLVDFQTNSKSKPNNIIVYLDMDNCKLIGYGYVD